MAPVRKKRKWQPASEVQEAASEDVPKDEDAPAARALPMDFGKKLAHTDKVQRDRGFRILKTWMKAHEDLGMLDYLKLWKGLYFAVWMADKRPVQQELNVNIALLLNEVPRPKRELWLAAYAATVHEAWEKLDKHRMGKYMQLVRIVMAEAFKSLRVGGWAVADVRVASASFCRGTAVQVSAGQPRTGLLIHFARIFWDELRPQLALTPTAPPEALGALLEPFCAIAEGSRIESLVKNVHELVLRRAPEEAVKVLAARLLAGAAKAETPKTNRDMLYETVDVLEKKAPGGVSEGGWVFPAAEPGPRKRKKTYGAADGYGRGAADGAEETKEQRSKKARKAKTAKSDKQAKRSKKVLGGSTEGKLMGKKRKKKVR